MILITRHGQTEWNTVDRMQGRRDSALTERGKEQAKTLASVLESYDPDRIISSPLGRAKQTSRIISEHAGLPVEFDNRLKEVDIGSYSGLSKEDIDDQDPGFLERRAKNKWTCRWPKGESYADAAERVSGLARSANKLHGSVILAHRSLNRALLRELLDLQPREALEIEQENDTLFEVRRNGTYHKRRYSAILSE